MPEKSCPICKENFQDGEVVAISSGEAYHYILEDYHIIAENLKKIPLDCSMKKAMKGATIFERKVYYNGKFYDIDKVEKIPNARNLTIEFNKKNTGDIIKGDLS